MDNTILWSLIIAVIGFLLTLIGIVWYEIDRRNNVPINNFVYILMIGGAIVVVAGLVLITGFFIQKNNTYQTQLVYNVVQ